MVSLIDTAICFDVYLHLTLADEGTQQSHRVSSLYKYEQRQYDPSLYSSKSRPWSADFKFRRQEEINMEV